MGIGGGARMLDPETPIQGGYRSLGCERRPDVHPRHLRPRLSSSLSAKRGMLASLLLLSSTSGPGKVSSPLRWRAPSPTCAIGGTARVTPVCTPSTQYPAQGARTQTRSGQPGKETISKVHVSRLHFGISVAGMFASSGRRYRPSLTEIPSLAGFSGERRTKMRAKRRNIEKGSQYPLQCPDLLALGFQGPLGLLTRPRRAKPGTPESEPRALGSHMHETVCFPAMMPQIPNPQSRRVSPRLGAGQRDLLAAAETRSKTKGSANSR